MLAIHRAEPAADTTFAASSLSAPETKPSKSLRALACRVETESGVAATGSRSCVVVPRAVANRSTRSMPGAAPPFSSLAMYCRLQPAARPRSAWVNPRESRNSRSLAAKSFNYLGMCQFRSTFGHRVPRKFIVAGVVKAIYLKVVIGYHKSDYNVLAGGLSSPRSVTLTGPQVLSMQDFTTASSTERPDYSRLTYMEAAKQTAEMRRSNRWSAVQTGVLAAQTAVMASIHGQLEQAKRQNAITSNTARTTSP